MMLETPPNDTRVVMPLPRPITDVSWDTDITISPNYVKDLNLVLSSGVENITYIATHPISRLRVSCQFSVNVVGTCKYNFLISVCVISEKFKHKPTNYRHKFDSHYT